MALRNSELLADLSEGAWDAANFYSDVFCMELAAWEITTGLASEIPRDSNSLPGRSISSALVSGESSSHVSMKSVEQGQKGAGDEHLSDEDPPSHRRF